MIFFSSVGAIDVLSAGGILRAPEVVELAAAARLDLAAAATMLVKESSGGHNVWGHDAVPTGGNYVKGAEVTQGAPPSATRPRGRSTAHRASARPSSPGPLSKTAPTTAAARGIGG